MMKDIMNKLANLEATAPKPKKMLTEDSTSPMITEPKARSLKDVFNEISETVAPGQKPLPVLDPQKKQAGMGFVTSNNPAIQNMLKNLDPKDVQIVQAPGQQSVGQQQQQGQPAPAGATGQPQAGQMQMKEKWAGDVKLNPAKKGMFKGKTKAELEKQLAALHKSGPHKKGSPEYTKQQELNFAIRAKGGWKESTEQLDELSNELLDRYARKSSRNLDKMVKNVQQYAWGRETPKGREKAFDKAADELKTKGSRRVKGHELANKKYFNQDVKVSGTGPQLEEEQLDELSPQTMKNYMRKSVEDEKMHSDRAPGPNVWKNGQLEPKYPESPKATYHARELGKRMKGQDLVHQKMNKKVLGRTALKVDEELEEGAKVDRMVKHIEKSERKLGKSKGEAEDIAWATANKRGMLDNKNKKKVKESQVNEIFGFSNKEKNVKAVKAWLASNGTNAANADLWPDRSPRFSVMTRTGNPIRRIDGELTRDGRLILQISTQQGYQAGKSEKSAGQWQSPQTDERNIDDPKFIPWFNQRVGASSVKEADIPSTRGDDTMGAGLGAGRSDEVLEGIMSDMSNGTKVLGNHHGFLIFLPSGHVVQPTKRPPFGQSTIGSGPDPIDDKEEWEKLPWNILEVGDPDEKDAWWDYGQKTLRMKPVDYSSLPRDLQTRATRLYQKYSSGQGPNAFAGRSFERFNKGKTMKNFAEGKWNYPEHMKKTVTTSDMGTTNAQDNRDARREFRKKEKAKAHAELMKGGKKVNEANEAETHFAILDPKLIDQISQMSGAAVEPDTNPPTVSSYDGNTVRQLLAFAQKYPDRLKKTQVLHRGLAQPAMAQPVGGFDKMGGPEYNLKEGKKKAKPDFLDMDKDGNKKESMKKAAADKKKKKVDESINHRISAARLEGKSHGLRGHAHSGKRYEDLEELKAYHEGYKDGLDECYGQGVYENAMPATVPGMADAAMDEGNALTAALAKTPKGGKFKVGGKSFTDHTTYDAQLDELSPATLGSYMGKAAPQAKTLGDKAVAAGYKAYSTGDKSDFDAYHHAIRKSSARDNGMDLAASKLTGRPAATGPMAGYNARVPATEDFAFESWSNQLNDLLNEGLSVSVSKGQQNSPDSVTITAQDAEAEQLLQLVKHAGLGLFGDEASHEPSSAMSVQPSHGAPDEVGAGGVDVEVVDGSDDMLSLMKKLSGVQASGSADYADEEGSEEHTCNECGMMETQCGCGGKEHVEEVESEDQMEYEVAEDNAPDSGAEDSVADEDAEAAEDGALAKSDMQNKTATVNEDGDEASEEGPESKEGGTDEEGETVSESFFDLLGKLSKLAESKDEDEDYDPEEDGPDHGKAWSDTSDELKEDTEEEDEKAEKAGKKVTKDIEYDDKKDKKEKVDEWANQVGKGPGKGTDASFEQDIDFMTKVIAGGLNKPKSTGQTTIPVIAGQEDRMHDNPQDWATLAGIKK